MQSHRKCFRILLAGVFLILLVRQASATHFSLVNPRQKVAIFYLPAGVGLDSIAANLLADDIERVSGYRPQVSSALSNASGNIIVIGRAGEKLFNRMGLTATEKLRGKWECYMLQVVEKPLPNVTQALVIAGSDARGTAYGVFDVSERIGVSPWYWWADVTPQRKNELEVDITLFESKEPSVKYRGIFLNDEDWGLQPWAAKTFEPETGDIGPKTYAKIFELLLRLKANLIWPAMHPSTKAFYHYPGNVKAAEVYRIVIGSSHAEPMLRNNVGEWDKKTLGAFNYLTNQEQVDAYWEARIKESKGADAIYTMGMRGVHDGAIEGVKTPAETVPLLEKIFKNQRGLLQQYVNPDITLVPQAFTAYKEVLEVYDAGLKVPEDITLVWPDDNYGYIQRLSNDTESKRSGGAGVYYHASYWGRPHDYLWLPSTHPALIREEMTKAYQLNSRTIWVMNVGDIKPIEYNMQFFLDAAYAIEPFMKEDAAQQHMLNWVRYNMGEMNAGNIRDILWKYYQLAFERRPEFMGWSQTEPSTPIHLTAYNHTYYGDQAQQRVDAYTALVKAADSLRNYLPAPLKDAYYQLVTYPVTCASLINQKFLYHDKAYLYSKQGRLTASVYDHLVQLSGERIFQQTDYYNNKLGNGKWTHMMSMQPRDLPVFKTPDSGYGLTPCASAWAVVPEGCTDTITEATAFQLPVFSEAGQQAYFLDVFLTRDTIVNFTVHSSADWIKISLTHGRVTAEGIAAQQRIWVTVDWNRAPHTSTATGSVQVTAGNRQYRLHVLAKRLSGREQGFVAANGYLSIYAAHYQLRTAAGKSNWSVINGLGPTGASVQALPFSAAAAGSTEKITDAAIRNNAMVGYQFYTDTAFPATITVHTLPTFPLNKNYEMRYAVSVDDGKPEVVNFRTVGRSTEWKQAVLSNSIARAVKIPSLPAGRHTLKIYMIDPGVILDRITIDQGGLQPYYGVIPESRFYAESH